MRTRATLGLTIVLAWTVASAAGVRPMTVDAEMRLHSIVDVRISPDGARVAYVVSRPSLEKNEHQAALFIVPAGGGASTALGDTVRIFNTPTPRPQLRWTPDSTVVSLVGFDANGRPGSVCDSDRRQCAASGHVRARRGVRLRMVTRWFPHRISHARSDARRRGSPASGQIVRDSRRCAGSAGAARGAGTRTGQQDA